MRTYKFYQSPLLKFLLGGMLFVPILQAQINPIWKKQYSPKKIGLVEGLSPDHFLLALAGLREFLSSILWVKGDVFFHEGNYDAMLPILKLSTVLDPHNIEIYSTGTWHMAYNFTDSDHRSDRRYLPAALVFAQEGAKNNPDSHELFFGLGMLWMHKIEDRPEKAVYWFKKACSKADILSANKSMLAHAFVKNSEISNALTTFENLLKEVKQDPESFDSYLETIENNIDSLLIRASERGFFTPTSKENLIYPPIDPQIKAQVKIISPKQIEIQGTIQLPFQGTRLRLVLRDKDFPFSKEGGADWEQIKSFSLEGMPGKTFLQDQLYVKNGQFKTILDLEKDPGIYPLNSPSYILEIFYDPRFAPHPIQNRVGIKGKGLKNVKIIGFGSSSERKIIHVHWELGLEQILRENRWKYITPILPSPLLKQ